MLSSKCWFNSFLIMIIYCFILMFCPFTTQFSSSPSVSFTTLNKFYLCGFGNSKYTKNFIDSVCLHLGYIYSHFYHSDTFGRLVTLLASSYAYYYKFICFVSFPWFSLSTWSYQLAINRQINNFTTQYYITTYRAKHYLISEAYQSDNKNISYVKRFWACKRNLV